MVHAWLHRFMTMLANPVCPTDGCHSPTRRVRVVCWCAHRHRWPARTTPRLSGSLVRVACISLSPSRTSRQTQNDGITTPFFSVNTSNFLFTLRSAIGTCMLLVRISVNKNLEHILVSPPCSYLRCAYCGEHPHYCLQRPVGITWGGSIS